MCVSCLERVVDNVDAKNVFVENIEGLISRASLLALDGPAPQAGDWVVVHSGYVIDRIDTLDAQRAVAEIRRGRQDADCTVLDRVRS
ncbi:MAG: HypC/HybG/HupF family hydrogenase formation chaperone [Acidimicrobiales bacterium]